MTWLPALDATPIRLRSSYRSLGKRPPFQLADRILIVKIKLMGRRALFLDRDGTVITEIGYARDPAKVELLPGVGSALAELKGAGFLLVLVSNQSGIGRGLIAPGEAESVHRRMEELLAERGVSLDASYYCPHVPEDGCRCRKPGIAHFHRAAMELGIDLASSFMVGDRATDAEAGNAAGCRTIVLSCDRGAESGADSRSGDAFVVNWPAIVTAISSCCAARYPKFVLDDLHAEVVQKR